jgi:glycerol-3-phosphate dehydrogenase
MNIVSRRPRVARLRRRGGRPLPVPGAVARRVDPRHQPRRPRGRPDALTVTAADLEAFLATAATAFPHARLDRADVRLVHRGLLPMVSGEGTHVTLLRESAVVDHAAHGCPGLVSIHGVRYTTARHTARARSTPSSAQLGSRHTPACRTDHDAAGRAASISSGRRPWKRACPARHRRGVPPICSRGWPHLRHRYDASCNMAREAPGAGRPARPGHPVTGAEIVYAARHEMAVTLADALIRRTEAGSARPALEHHQREQRVRVVLAAGHVLVDQARHLGRLEQPARAEALRRQQRRASAAAGRGAASSSSGC